MKFKSFILKNKIVILIILAFVLLICIFAGNKNRNSVKNAITIFEAKQKEDNESYFIVEDKYGSWQCNNNPVILIGRTPASELAGYIMDEEASNKFLVHGYREDDMSKYFSLDIIFVDAWEIIAPIRRTYAIEDPNYRLFSPLLFLDNYDVKTGGYKQIVYDKRALDYYEKKYIMETSSIPCYIVTSDIEDGIVKWYLLDEDTNNEYSVCLEGDTPDKYLDENILSKKHNKFLVLGNTKDTIINVEKWDIVYPIVRNNEYDYYESFYYFTYEDMMNGTYIP